MKRQLTLRQLIFSALLAGVQNLLSSFLTLALCLSLLLVMQSERIDKVARWVKAEPATRARMLETWLAKRDFVERVAIAKVERAVERNQDAHKKGWIVSEASFLLASGVEARFRSLSLSPRQLRVQGLQVLGLRVVDTAETAEDKRQKRNTKRPTKEFWYKIVRQIGFITSLATEHTLKLEDSLILLEDNKGQPLLRLRFALIVADNRNGLTWRGHGFAEGGGAESRQPVVLAGSYAIASKRLFQSLRIEGFSPREALSLIDRNKTFDDKPAAEAGSKQTNLAQHSKTTRRWLEGKGQVSLDYRLDLRERQSWFRARFVRNTNANVLDKKAALAFDHSIDSRRTGSTNTSLSVRALPLDIVWHASDLLLPARLSRQAMPFRLEGTVSGRVSLQQQQQQPRQFLGNLLLETPRFRWNESDKSALAHRLTLSIEGNDERLQIAASLDFDPAKESGLDNSIVILPYEESAPQQNIRPARLSSRERKKIHPSKFRLTLEGTSRGGVPIQTVRTLWPPRFKPQTRAVVVEVVKEGELTDLTLALDALIDRKAKTRRLTNLDGSFLWQKGRLQLFAAPATLTDIKARARFTKREILFKVARARYGDFRIDEGGEVSFERKTLANDEKHTRMRLAIKGEGAAESLRRFALNAPFLQELTSLQRSARWLPRAPRATAKGHFNLTAFLAQLDVEAPETIFPSLLSYDTAWQVESIRLQAPFLRFYEGSATLTSSSSVPLLLAARLDSDRGLTLKGRWHIALPNAKAVRQRQEVQRLTLQGSLDAKALEDDFAYLPKDWIQQDLPLSLSYREKAGVSTQGLLSLVFPRSRLRVESSQPVRDETVRLSGSILRKETNTNSDASTQSQTQAPAWQIEGKFRPQGKTAILIERGRGEQKRKSLAMSLENLPSLEGKTTPETTPKQKTPAEWRLTLAGEQLDLSRWLEQKPWRTFTEKKRGEEKGGEALPSLGWGGLFNLTFDARLKKLQLQKNAAASSASRPNDLLENVHASLRWQDEKIREASFSSHSLLFSRSETRQRLQAQRRVRTQAFYTLREGHELVSAYIEDLGSFLHQALGRNTADGGRTQLSLVRPHKEGQRPKPHFEGYASIRNVSLYNLPLLLKIFDAADFVSLFNKGIRGLDVRSDLQMWDGILTLKEFRLSNNLTALSANGSLDLTQRKLDLRGEIASLHFVSKILRNIPLIGTIVVGRKRHNLFAFSYEAKGGWNNPQVQSSPLNIFLPGIVKIANPLQLLERDDIKKDQDKKREQIAAEQNNKTDEEATKPADEER